MKNLKIISALIALFAAFNFSSCSTDVEPVDPAIVIPDPGTNPGGGTGDPGVFKVDIDGNHYTAATTLVYITGGSIQISAIRSQGDSFGFLLNGTAAGSFAANSSANLVAYTPAGSEFGYWGNNPDDEAADTGEVVVTSVDATHHTISGTFHFTGYWSDGDDATPPAPKHFTNGVFTNLPYVTTSPTDDVFLAKVNGVDYNQNDLLAITDDFSGVEYISIGTTNAAGQGMTVSVKSSLGTGTYSITGDLATDVVQIVFSPNDTDEGHANSGTVTITEKTASRIKGTFSGTVVIGATSYAITAGSFDVAY